MIAPPMVEVRCAVCAGDRHEPICSAREIEVHLEYLRLFHQHRLLPQAPAGELADRSDFTQQYATDLVACQGCGLVFRNPRPPADAVARLYADDQYGAKRLEGLAAAQRELYRPKVATLRRWLGGQARVVEVGSFVGGFLEVGATAGWEMLGVDPGAEVTDYCLSRKLPVLRGTLEELRRSPLAERWGPGTVDCVAIWNTFDQVPDPDVLLTQARALLRPGGILAIRVPNGACFRESMALMRRLPSPFAGWLRALLAWNNLLAFPYLHGFSVRTLDWMSHWHGLDRVGVTPDTLCRLADDSNQAWAVWEEGALKQLARTIARLEARRDNSLLTSAPWFDAYYRRRG